MCNIFKFSSGVFLLGIAINSFPVLQLSLCHVSKKNYQMSQIHCFHFTLRVYFLILTSVISMMFHHLPDYHVNKYPYLFIMKLLFILFIFVLNNFMLNQSSILYNFISKRTIEELSISFPTFTLQLPTISTTKGRTIVKCLCIIINV